MNAEQNEMDSLNENKKYAEVRYGKLRIISSFLFTVLCIIAIAVCIICDLALTKKLTWSRYPISSVIFSWFIIVPIIKYGKRGIFLSLISLSLLIIPYLHALNRIIGISSPLVPMGTRISVISILYLWAIYFLFHKLCTRRLLALSISLLLAVPVSFLINTTVWMFVPDALFDIWDVLAYVTIVTMALLVGWLEYLVNRKSHR